jgi:exodeoxyribonuclease-3
MRIATWNVNSLKARLEKVSWWLERARPDVLLLQETKLADDGAPVAAFREAGYELVHHGEGRWNGVAIAARGGIGDVVTNFGEPLRPARTADAGDDEPLAEARMIAATCGGVRVVSLYAPNGRSVDSPFYHAKLAWYERLAGWLERASDPAEPLVLGGDFNLAPEDRDVRSGWRWRGSSALASVQRLRNCAGRRGKAGWPAGPGPRQCAAACLSTPGLSSSATLCQAPRRCPDCHQG